jgi:hypothetical protein
LAGAVQVAQVAAEFADPTTSALLEALFPKRPSYTWFLV